MCVPTAIEHGIQAGNLVQSVTSASVFSALCVSSAFNSSLIKNKLCCVDKNKKIEKKKLLLPPSVRRSRTAPTV